jgi:hypothetical protein
MQRLGTKMIELAIQNAIRQITVDHSCGGGMSARGYQMIHGVEQVRYELELLNKNKHDLPLDPHHE